MPRQLVYQSLQFGGVSGMTPRWNLRGGALSSLQGAGTLVPILEKASWRRMEDSKQADFQPCIRCPILLLLVLPREFRQTYVFVMLESRRKSHSRRSLGRTPQNIHFLYCTDSSKSETQCGETNKWEGKGHLPLSRRLH
jgi:hypothetical protein